MKHLEQSKQIDIYNLDCKQIITSPLLSYSSLSLRACSWELKTALSPNRQEAYCE